MDLSQPSCAATADALDRPPSVRSVASASSLTRRSRTRTRSKTVTESVSAKADRLPDEKSLKSEFLNVTQGYSPASSSSTPSSPIMNVHLLGGTHLAGFGEVIETGSSHIQQEDDTLVVGEQPKTNVENVIVSLPKSKLHKAAVQAATLARINTAAKPPPSAFARVPHTPRNGSNVRDSMNSVGTRISTTSSSLYPPSTSTASGTESPPSPRSLAEQIEDHAVSSYDPDMDEVHAFDGDDVSYRLRLLVKNSYFLPPAHVKPTPSDFAHAQSVQKKPARTATPTFLDIFRVGKSKSKPPSPEASPALDSRVPALRMTGESVTLGAYPSRHHPRTPAAPVHSPLASHKPPDLSARVVVVREKMHDLVTAAKQAEQEMKARGVRRDDEPQPAKAEIFDDVIDPTDVVDLPPPSSKYPFAVQASALHGLGVQDSVGAAVLADRLPPPTSPGVSSMDTEDRNWRKALLHAAVGHSLDNTPDISTLSITPDATSPLASPWRTPAASPPASRTQSPSAKRVLGQRILSQPLIEVHNDGGRVPVQDHSTPRPSANAAKRPPPKLETQTPESRRSSYFPMRAETPAGPQTPLAPPPRRNIINPLYSLSQTDLLAADAVPQGNGASQERGNAVDIRSTLSSPELSETYESARLMVMTPPPATHLSAYSGSSVFTTRPSTGVSNQEPSTSTASSIINAETAESHYSDDDQDDDDDHLRRASTALSVPTEGRPSLSVSEYSQPSPTVSAFQDALTGDDYHSAVSSFNGPWRGSEDHPPTSTPRDSPMPRYSTVSPPPRTSSSLAPFPLSPPPPPRSLHQAVTGVRPTFIQQSSFLDLGEPSTSSTSGPVMEITAPEPVTPPFPISERRGNPASPPLTLNIPVDPIPVTIHSAPPPSSPTSFFDSIQAQPNAMDDLESSSDEDSDEEDEDNDGRGPTNLYIDHQTRTRTISTMTARPPVRANFMRLGNHSTPHIAKPLEGRPPLPFGVADKRPIVNVPPRAPFFSEKKFGKGNGLPSSTFDFNQYSSMGAAEDPGPSTRRRPATADQTLKSWQANQLESSKRLEGMLKQHMEAEKDVIRRIASTLHSNSSSPTSGTK